MHVFLLYHWMIFFFPRDLADDIVYQLLIILFEHFTACCSLLYKFNFYLSLFLLFLFLRFLVQMSGHHNFVTVRRNSSLGTLSCARHPILRDKVQEVISFARFMLWNRLWELKVDLFNCFLHCIIYYTRMISVLMYWWWWLLCAHSLLLFLNLYYFN